MLAASLRGTWRQLLMRRPTVSRPGRGDEILIQRRVSSIIREGGRETQDVLISRRAKACNSWDDAILALLNQKVVSPREAYMKAIDKTRFRPSSRTMTRRATR